MQDDEFLKTTPGTQMWWEIDRRPWWRRMFYRGKHVKRHSLWWYLYAVVLFVLTITGILLTGLVHV